MLGYVELKQHISADNLTEEYGGSLKMSDEARFIPLVPETEEREDLEKTEKYKKILSE